MIDLDLLRRDGIAELSPTPLTPAQGEEIAAHLRVAPCYPGHVKVYGDGQPRDYPTAATSLDLWCHDLVDVLTAPHFWELALSLFPMVARYLAASPRLYSVNAFWAAPADGPPTKDLQTWHRDRDDDRFLALFVYGTPVMGVQDGPHRYQRGTHAAGGLPGMSGSTRTVYGPPGTAFLADTRGLHMGERPTTGPRLLLWARWGVSERPWAYDNDQTVPVDRATLGDRYPNDSRLRELVSLVVR